MATSHLCHEFVIKTYQQEYKKLLQLLCIVISITTENILRLLQVTVV